MRLNFLVFGNEKNEHLCNLSNENLKFVTS